LPTDECERDFAEQAVEFFSFESLMTCTPPNPIGGKFTAAADDASQQAITARSAAVEKRIVQGYWSSALRRSHAYDGRVRLSGIFRRKPESPPEAEALDNLDRETREVASQELDKEAEREQGHLWQPIGALDAGSKPAPLQQVEGDPVLEPVDDPDPSDEHGLRDALHQHDESE
jgi:hypothetical protein